MMEISREEAWQLASILVGVVVTIGVAVLIYFLQKKHKELAFGVLSSRTLLTVAEELAQRVVVSFDGAPIPNIQLVELGLKNSGDLSILASDFERPLTIKLGADARILSADITRQSPNNLNARVVSSDNSIVIEPMLFNSGDYIVVKVLVSVTDFQLSPDTRIIGVPVLAPINEGLRLSPGSTRFRVLRLIEMAGIFLFLGLIIHFDLFEVITPPPGKPPTPPLSLTQLIVLPLLMLLLAMVTITLIEWFVGRFKNTARRYIEITVDKPRFPF